MYKVTCEIKPSIIENAINYPSGQGISIKKWQGEEKGLVEIYVLSQKIQFDVWSISDISKEDLTQFKKIEIDIIPERFKNEG